MREAFKAPQLEKVRVREGYSKVRLAASVFSNHNLPLCKPAYYPPPPVDILLFISILKSSSCVSSCACRV